MNKQLQAHCSLLVLAMWAGLIGSVWLATVVVLAMRSI